ncbi:GDSL esterase/lipase At5g03610-like [Nymphaea colorata]|nr:GDSL esterase/lipase At5g03610-like [Nymphaea colorata]
MGAKFFLCLFVVLLLGSKSDGYEENDSRHHRHHHHHHHHHHRHRLGYSQKVLFVFGDSYVDTGNINQSLSKSWKDPYGITFPGKPSGRFSDGRVFTDFVAAYMGIPNPVTYRVREVAGKRKQFGMNFAYGGTGVFNTLVALPNMTTQIDFFEKLIKTGVYDETDLKSSIALVSVAGNDYSAYLTKNNGSFAGLTTFVEAVVNQTAANVKRILGLGVQKVAMMGMQPLGCLPTRTRATSYKSCDAQSNMAVAYHNELLRKAVGSINATLSPPSKIAILDLYGSFNSVLQGSKFKDPLKPCCRGVNSSFTCGNVDQQGNKLYELCSTPVSTFFWDEVHPTQDGWTTVVPSLMPTLHALLS